MRNTWSPLINVVICLVVLSTGTVRSEQPQQAEWKDAINVNSNLQHVIANHHLHNSPVNQANLNYRTTKMPPIQIYFHIPNISSLSTIEPAKTNSSTKQRHVSKPKQEEMFRCLAGNRSIKMDKVCDGISHCPNGSDEGELCKNELSLIVQTHRDRVYQLFILSMVTILTSNLVLIVFVCLNCHRIHKVHSVCHQDNTTEVVQLEQYFPLSNTDTDIETVHYNLPSNNQDAEYYNVVEVPDSTDAIDSIEEKNEKPNQSITNTNSPGRNCNVSKPDSVQHSTPTPLPLLEQSGNRQLSVIDEDNDNVIICEDSTDIGGNIHCGQFHSVKQACSCNNCAAFTTAICNCKSKSNSKLNFVANNCCSQMCQDGLICETPLNGSTLYKSNQTYRNTCCNVDAGTNQIILRPITIVRLPVNHSSHNNNNNNNK